MKQRLGGLLAIALGAVLITSGLNNSAAGSVGAVVLDCGAPAPGVVVACPVATITFHETTTPTPGPGDPTLPVGGWTVKITSTCDDPVNGLPVSQDVTVTNNGTGTSTDLEVFTTSAHNNKCEYSFLEEPVEGFTPTFDPAGPIQLNFSVDTEATNNVDLANTFEEAPPSTTSAAPSSSVASSPSSSTGQLADTGPRSQIGISLWFGIALCLLGVGLVFGGTSFRRRGNHT